MNHIKLAIIIPVFNDWDSLNKLIPDIDNALKGEDVTIALIIVNDASTEEVNIDSDVIDRSGIINKMEIIHLNCNMGHQRAIAIGLTEVGSMDPIDAVVVMDSDGEDRPEDIKKLICKHRHEMDKIIVARRDQRSESALFQLGYLVYKCLFRVFTGKRIDFGNFCLIPIGIVNRLIYLDSLWNHLPATVLRSKLPVAMVSTKRGMRLKGKAQMNLGGLVLLGLSAVSVYIDIALLRTLLLSIFFSAVTVAGIVIVTIIRLFTDMAIPGWASNVVGSLTVILFLSFMISIFVLFVNLSNRSQLTIIPARHISDYINKIETIYPK